MPQTEKLRIPSCRRHRPSGQAIVTVQQKDHYLGPWRSTESKLAYERLISEWLANGRHLPHGNSQGAQDDIAIIELMRLTGARCGEIVQMRGIDLDVSGSVWLSRPGSHKTQHHGHGRVIEIGPRAQEIMKPFLKADLSAYLFGLADAMAEYNARRREERETPANCLPGSVVVASQ